MSRQPIQGIQSHPEQAKLSGYSEQVPEGTYVVRLDDRAWGKSTNLFCYFSMVEGEERFRLSVFHRQDYKPYDGGPKMDEELIGARFEVTVGKSQRSGMPTFKFANKIAEPS